MKSLALAWLLATTAGAVEVPFELTGRVILIQAKLNGRGPYRLILDTGATETVLTPATAKALGLHTSGIGPGQAVGTLDSLTIGDAGAIHLPVFIYEPPQALSLRLDHGVDYHGILGYSFLKNYVLRIDYRQHIVTFSTNALVGGIPFTADARLIHATGRMNDRGPLLFLVDSGAADSILLPATAAALGVRGEPLPTQRGAAFAVVDKVAVGATVATKVPFIIHTPVQDNGTPPAYQAILGYNFLSRYLVTIDYRRQVMQFTPHAGDR